MVKHVNELGVRNENIFIIIPIQVLLNIYRYFFEEGLTRILLEYLKLGMAFFNIGSHFGNSTLLSSFLVSIEGQVYFFESTPSSFNMLEANVVLKNCAVFNNKRTERTHLVRKRLGRRL
jgi:hypothetical protein